MRDYTTKVDNTAPAGTGILAADEDNARFEELKQAVKRAGITLDPDGGPNTDTQMLAQAMARYASGGVVGTDGGAADAYVITSISGAGATSFRMPQALFDGMRAFWEPANNNTGACTANIWGLGAKSIKDYAGNDPAADLIVSGRAVETIYDSGSDTHVLAPWCTLVLSPTAKPSFFTAALTTPPTIANNSFTKVTGWTASTTGLLASSFASNRLTIAGDGAGLWHFYAKSIISTEEQVLTIYKNGSASPIANGDGYLSETTYGRYAMCSGFIELAATDYVEIYQYQRNAATASIAISSAEWGGHKIRA